MNNADLILPLMERARQAYAARQFTLCADLYSQAAEHFAAQGDGLQSAEMRNNQSVALLRSGDCAAALKAVADTANIFEQAGDARRQAMALGNRAAALEELGRLDEALLDYRQASELLKTIDERDLRAVVLKRISAIQIKMKKPVEALFAMDAAVEDSRQRSWSEKLIHRLMAFIKKQMGLS